MNENNQNGFGEENRNGMQDDFIIGKGFSVAEPEEIRTKNKRVKKSSGAKNVIKNTVWILAIIIVSVGIAFGVIYAGADYLGIGFGRGESCVVEIPQGAPTPIIAEKLKESGAVKIPFLFRVYSKLKHFDSQYKYGVYSFNNEAGYDVLAEMLMTEGAKAESVKVKIPEGATVDDIAELLEANNVCSKDDFLDAVQHKSFDYDFVKQIPEESVYYRLEGYLFPDTYDFYCYDSEECAYLAVDKMLKNLDSKLDYETKNKISSGKFSFHEIMTLASIVEMESSGIDEEAPNVAAVFINRLKSSDFSTLGSSPTRKYPHGNGRYNTYEVKGLPPGPMCSASLQSILACVSPTENFDYYYFVTDANMKFYYNKTLAQHNNIIAKLKREKNWIYEEW